MKNTHSTLIVIAFAAVVLLMITVPLLRSITGGQTTTQAHASYNRQLDQVMADINRQQ